MTPRRRHATPPRRARRRTRAVAEALNDEPRTRIRTTRVGIGDFLMQFTLIWIIASAILKFTYKGRLQAEVQAGRRPRPPRPSR